MSVFVLNDTHRVYRVQSQVWVPYERQTCKQSRFPAVFLSGVQNKSIPSDDVTVSTRARQLKPFYRINHWISYGDSTQLQIFERVWMFRGHTAQTTNIPGDFTDASFKKLINLHFIRHWFVRAACQRKFAWYSGQEGMCIDTPRCRRTLCITKGFWYCGYRWVRFSKTLQTKPSP